MSFFDDWKEWSTAKKALSIIVVCCIGIIIIGIIGGGLSPDKNTDDTQNNSYNTQNTNTGSVKELTTPYGTKCKLDIGSGINAEETVVNDDGQKIVFDDGYREGIFISTTNDVSDLINGIESSGKKCRDGDIVWYHIENQELANTWSPFAGEHLKLETTSEYDVGFMKNPNSDETIILVAGPDTIIDCFKSIQWG